MSPDLGLRRLAPGLVVGLIVPLVVYLVARPRVRGDAAALAGYATHPVEFAHRLHQVLSDGR